MTKKIDAELMMVGHTWKKVVLVFTLVLLGCT